MVSVGGQYEVACLHSDPEEPFWFENWGVVGPGLKTEGVENRDLKTGGVVGPKKSTEGGT